MKVSNRILIFILTLILIGCNSNKQCLCPDLYAPVCAENGKTYSNPCEAECDDVQYIDGECPVYGIGMVEFSGDSVCGFYISIFGTSYKPQELADEFKEQNKTVTLRYRRLNQYYTCDLPYAHNQIIEILEIDAI